MTPANVDCVKRAAEPISCEQWNSGYGADSGPSRGDPRIGAIRPSATSTAAVCNVRNTEGFRTPALCRCAVTGRGAGGGKSRKEETAGRKRRGVVTLSKRRREAGLLCGTSSGRDDLAPRGHRCGAEHAVRLS